MNQETKKNHQHYKLTENDRINEFDDEFPNQPDIGTRVQITKDGKLIKTPDWMINYRHPDYEVINRIRR